MIKDISLRVKPVVASSSDKVRDELLAYLGKEAKKLNDFRIIRRSIDARKSPVMINLLVRIATGEDEKVESTFKPVEFKPVSEDAPVVIIVGAGPAGLFAGLEALRNGIRPIILERGRDVERRRLDIANISRQKRINPDSNYCFGEGGAGAYSDGKLYTRSKKRGSVEEVLQLLVQHGATPDILIDAHPHIGSDNLPNVIKAIRNTITENGGEVRFEARADGLIMKEGRAVGVMTETGEVLGDAVVLATGHSAHDTFRAVYEAGVAVEPKGIAVGVRLEHPQKLIDRMQYHSHEGRGKYLPAAEYSFVAQAADRGVYSFCMCPGGVIVPAGSSDHELVVNGMSASARAGKWANSGMVVELHPGDLPELAAPGPLEMLEVQEALERKMFEAAGNTIQAPAQRMKDFVDGKVSVDLPDSSYAPGLLAADFNKIFPGFISSRLRDGFNTFGRRAKGFLTNDAVMIGLESRTSSPVRITRDPVTLESVSTPGLYPAGEGAGYAGGIVSAAIDGMRCIRAFADSIHVRHDNKKLEK
ncbi:MAG: FAD-binding protein [Muribaculaceae bacterium]|nr:FAD-binding protein [Muribaculaceae bacterium]